MTLTFSEPSHHVIRAALEAHGGLDRWRKVAYVTAGSWPPEQARHSCGPFTQTGEGLQLAARLTSAPIR